MGMVHSLEISLRIPGGIPESGGGTTRKELEKKDEVQISMITHVYLLNLKLNDSDFRSAAKFTKFTVVSAQRSPA